MKRGRHLTPEPTPVEPRGGTRFSDQIAFLTADWGNRNLKQMLTGNRLSATVMENSVAVLKESDWKKYSDRFRYSPSRFDNTQLFGYLSRHEDKEQREWIYVAVGNHAREYGRTKELTEEIKYDYNSYWGAVVCSQLLTAFPDGYDHIVLALAHPTKSIGQRETMVRATGGRHRVKLPNGKEIRFHVREILPWDEPVGGIICWTESLRSQYNSFDLESGHRILVVDIGGGVTSFTRVTVQRDQAGRLQFFPVYNLEQSPSISMGIHNVLDRLQNILSTDYPAFTGMKDTLDRPMLESGIRTGSIELSGDPVDVADACAFAEFDLLDQIRTSYNNKLGGGRPFKLIVTTGGGMSTYHKRLADEVFNHRYVESALSLEQIMWGNLYGGDELFRQWIERERSLA